MNTQHSCVLPDEDATLAAGARLAQAADNHGVIALHGNLGSGKTTLCRGLIRALGHTGAVKSPTFTLVEPYEFPSSHEPIKSRVLHYDLYRLTDPEEVEFLGMRDFLDGRTLTLIEWPEKAAGFLPPADLELSLEVLDAGRRLRWQALTSHGEKLAAALAQAAQNL
jgi:tRNA threonylcarbamoyladenosine biosynthesis protein TsaE